MVQHLGRSPASGEQQRSVALTMAMGQPVGVRARALFALLALCTAGLFAATLWGEWRPAWKKSRRVLSAGVIDAGATVATDGRVPQIHDAAAGVVDRCIACHAADAKPRQPWYVAAAAGHPSPLLEVHDVQVIGCTACHDGQGRATRLPDAHGETPEWRLPLLRGALVQASCSRCHSAVTAPCAPLLRRGARLMQHHACDGCHQISGPDRRGKIGPNLAFAAHRAPPEWLWAWLKRPRDLLPGARMGNFGLSDEQAADLVAYLSHIKAPPPWLAAASGSGTDDGATEAQLDARYEAGLRVFRTARCLSCHAVAGVGGSIGPDLAHIGNKLSVAALDAWIENPARLHPGTRMPRFRLSPSDRVALVYYLSEETRDPDVEDRLVVARERYGELANAAASDRGATLFAERGCGGCHATTADGPPATNIKRVGPELAAFGSKRVERLVFPDDWYGQRTRVAWTRAKLTQPRSTSKTDIMPSFELSEDDLDALLVATLALREPWPEAFRAGPLVEPEPQTPPGPAGELMSELRCLTCHRLGGSGGSLAPPLDEVGSRVQYDWLREFLLAPDTVRPGLVERMPHFYLTRVEAETLARYLEAACQRRELPVLDESHEGLAAAAAGVTLYDQLECRACHIVGANGGSLGPNLTRVAQRLQPRWMALQLGDPRAAEVDEPVFDLDTEQVQQLVAYLETLRGDAPRVNSLPSEINPSSQSINQPR